MKPDMNDLLSMAILIDIANEKNRTGKRIFCSVRYLEEMFQFLIGTVSRGLLR